VTSPEPRAARPTADAAGAPALPAVSPPSTGGWLRRRLPRNFGALGLALVVISGGVATSIIREMSPDNGSSATPGLTLSDPFVGTPAESFPDAAAGVAVPSDTTAPVAGFTPEEVGANLGHVRDAVLAARIQSRMLVDHDPSEFVGMFAPNLQAEIQKYFDDGEFANMATQIAPGHTLTKDSVRTSGTMTYGETTIDGIRYLEVQTNYVWVYPFAGRLEAYGDHLVVVHDKISWIFPAAEDVAAEDVGMWFNGAQAYASNIDCELLERSLLGLGRPLPSSSEGPDPDRVFSVNTSLDGPDTC